MKIRAGQKIKIGSLGLAAILIILASQCFGFNKHGSVESKKFNYIDKNSELAGSIIYTKHAKCRMSCRYIDEAEVIDVIQNGKINNRKSNPDAQPCPVIVKERRSFDQQLARVVYANCSNVLKIITVIDLENEFKCYCK